MQKSLIRLQWFIFVNVFIIYIYIYIYIYIKYLFLCENNTKDKVIFYYKIVIAVKINKKHNIFINMYYIIKTNVLNNNNYYYFIYHV